LHSRYRQKYREIFFAYNGPGPYKCEFCKEDVMFTEVLVHHCDEDISNNIPENLKAAHRRCHGRHHMKNPKELAKLAANKRKENRQLQNHAL